MDIVERLRGKAMGAVAWVQSAPELCHQAADEIERLRAALASKSAPGIDKTEGCVEPMCMCKDRPASKCPGAWEKGCDLGANPGFASVYAAPQQRKPLTQDEVLDMAEGCTLQFHDLLAFARAIEQAHGIGCKP